MLVDSSTRMKHAFIEENDAFQVPGIISQFKKNLLRIDQPARTIFRQQLLSKTFLVRKHF